MSKTAREPTQYTLTRVQFVNRLLIEGKEGLSNKCFPDTVRYFRNSIRTTDSLYETARTFIRGFTRRRQHDHGAGGIVGKDARGWTRKSSSLSPRQWQLVLKHSGFGRARVCV